jgi:YspA SLOG family
MHNIGIVGHRAGNFHIEESKLKSKIQEVLDTLSFQYGEELCLNVDGETGVGLYVVQAAQKLNIKYHIFLPCPIEFVGQEWFDSQRHELELYFQKAHSTTTMSSRPSAANEKDRDLCLVNYSSFLICFWDGCRQGRTFGIIKQALTTNKLVLNGLNGLKMISAIDLKKRRTQ